MNVLLLIVFLMENRFGLIPFSGPMAVMVGKPIRVEQDLEPSDATVEFYHKVSFILYISYSQM